MANSITLSQSLVDDISQKIQDGTATAEQVVLYTKGLQQLQGGNDFQAVIIGLSQSAVDAIDSSNAQFQEDSQAAIDAITTIFNTTATDIDASADNAVAAINNAKDTLNASSVNLETTISGLPSLTQIREGVYNDSNYIHPYERPAYVIISDPTSNNYETRVMWYDHNHNLIHDEKSGFPRTSTFYFGDWELNYTDNTRQYSGDQNYNQDYASSGNVGFLYAYTYPSSNSWGSYGMMTSANNMYGSIYGQFNDRDILPRGIKGTWNAEWMRDNGVVVGTSDTRWLISRTNTEITLAGSLSPQTSTIRQHNTRGFWRDNTNYANNYVRGTGYMDRNDMWKITNETFTLTDISTGYGNVCYNQNINKMVVMNSDGSYNQTPKVYSFSSDFNIPNIAKGVQQIDYNYDAIGNLKATKEIDGTVDNSTGRPSPNQAESNYRGVPVLCDNGAVVHHVHLPGNVSGGAFTTRWVPNTAGDDLIYDAHFTHSGNTTNYGYEQGSNYGVRHAVSNDGKYVVAYNSYYYYGSGIKSTFIRISDGKVIIWDYNDTNYGFYMVPSKKSEFITGIMGHGRNNYQFVVDMDYIFAENADGTFVDVYATGHYNNNNIIFPGAQTVSSGIIQSIYKENSPEMQYINDDHVDTRTL